MASLSDSIQDRLGLPVLAEIPLATDGTIPSPPSEPFLEGVRFLRGGLQWHQLPPPIIAVVPVTPSARSLTVARYLARSFAEAGRTTRLVATVGRLELTPLLPLPAGAALPIEIFAEPSQVAHGDGASTADLTVVYCAPEVEALSSIGGAGASVLLVDDSCSVEDVQQVMANCEAATVPAIAAAVLVRQRGRRSLLRNVFARFR